MAKAKPMRTKLLKIVQKGITARRIDVHGIPMFEINNEIAKSNCPRHTLIKSSLSDLKDVVRKYRLETARQLAPSKKKKKDEEKPEETDIIIV